MQPAQAAQSRPHAGLLAAVRSCDAGSRALLERVVAIDSGTGDAEGLRAVGAAYAAELTKLGADVRRIAPTPPALGDNLLATLTGRGQRGSSGRVLLIAHMDTVFARGDVARRPPRWDGDRYVGPGAGDDKQGGVLALCALSALKAIGYRDFARIELLLNASEETGSAGSRELIRERARAADLAINLERGIPGDKVLVARKGSAVLTFDVHGRSAHSGLEPEKGRNAALEAARVALALGSLADPAAQTTITVDMLHSGDRTNVVPDRAQIKADVRAFTAAEFDRVERAAAALASRPGIDGVTMQSSLERSFPPWPRTATTEALVGRAARLYAELGRTLGAVEVGSSADVALAAETGTPALDGFGMEGGGAHGSEDYVDFATLVPRAYLLARLLMDAGRDPPARPRQGE
jgi:glutamate carboxypeptidase